MRKTNGFGVIVAAALLAGCTHLSTLPEARTATSDAALEGVPYSLPMLQYDLAEHYALQTCPREITLKYAGEETRFTVSGLKFGMKVEATPTYIPAETYVVDYEALSSPFKVTGFGIETYDNGALKSINAAAEDQTGDVIKSVLSAGFSLATAFGTGLPVLPDAAPVPGGAANIEEMQVVVTGSRRLGAKEWRAPPFSFADLEEILIPARAIVCSDAAIAAQEKLTATTAALEEATDAADRATHDVERLTLVTAAKQSTAAHVDALDAALKAAYVAQTALETADGKQGTARKALTFERERYWPTTPSDRLHDVDVPEAVPQFTKLLRVADIRVASIDAVGSWLSRLDTKTRTALIAAQDAPTKAFFTEFFDDAGKPLRGVTPPDLGPSACLSNSGQGDPKIIACVKAQLAYRLSLTASEAVAPDCSGKPGDSIYCLRTQTVDERRKGAGRLARDAVADPGIFIRPPGHAAFLACRPQPTRDEPDKCVELASDRDVLAPQLGQLRFLRFENKPFESGKLSLVLRENGAIETMGYSRTTSSARSAAGAAADAADQIDKYTAARDKQRADSRKAAREESIAQIQYQIDLLAKRKALLDAQKPEEPDAQKAVKDETAALLADIALLNAKLAKIKAEVALAEGGGS